MANKIFTGATDFSWATSTNWSPTGVPVDGDNVYLRNSNIRITSGLDQHNVQLNSLNVENTYYATVGSQQESLYIGANYVNYSGSQEFNLKIVQADSTDSQSADDSYVRHQGSGPLYLSGQAIELQLYSGTTYVAALTANDVYNERVSSLILTATGTKTISRLFVLGGSVTQHAGTVVNCMMRGDSYEIWNGTLEYIEQLGGSLMWLTDSTLESALVYGGTFSVGQDQRTRTIDLLEAHSGTVIDLRNGAGTVTVTSELNYGATWYKDPGEN